MLFSKIILKGSSTHVISDSFHKEKMSTFKIKRVMTFCSVDKRVIFFFETHKRVPVFFGVSSSKPEKVL